MTLSVDGCLDTHHLRIPMAIATYTWHITEKSLGQTNRTSLCMPITQLRKQVSCAKWSAMHLAQRATKCCADNFLACLAKSIFSEVHSAEYFSCNSYSSWLRPCSSIHSLIFSFGCFPTSPCGASWTDFDPLPNTAGYAQTTTDELPLTPYANTSLRDYFSYRSTWAGTLRTMRMPESHFDRFPNITACSERLDMSQTGTSSAATPLFGGHWRAKLHQIISTTPVVLIPEALNTLGLWPNYSE